MKHELAIIVAMSNDNIIGQDNDLPWHLQNDLKRFKELTLNSTVVMGRKTYESIGKALPNRNNIVLTRDQDFYINHPEAKDKVKVVTDFDAILDVLNTLQEKTFIIGGGEIYRLFLPSVNRIYLTKVDTWLHEGTTFPEQKLSDWIVEECSQKYPKDENHTEEYQFITYKRKLIC